MRMRIRPILLLLVLLAGVSTAQMQEDLPLSPAVALNSEMIPLTSEANGHDYRLYISLPDSYSTSEQTYPVLYLLDPVISFFMVESFVRYAAWSDLLPEMIVVGIGYPSENLDELLPLRDRDSYTAPDDFLEFIRTEVFPLVEANYRTTPEDRGLIGYRVTGDFVFHVMLAAPELFNRYAVIQSSGSELMPYLMRDDDSFRNSFAERDIKLFISASGTEILSSALQARAYEGLDVTGLSTGDLNLAAVLPVSLPQAIVAMYGA